MVQEAESALRSTLWRIDRFELIFYNPRHNRWQYFAENPIALGSTYQSEEYSKESLHRREIRGLLRTIRETFKLLVPSAVFSLRELRQANPTDDKIEVEPPLADLVPSAKWSTYLKYLKQTAEGEGVPESHLQNLEAWINDPGQKRCFSSAEALTVLSLLPIMEDWDTWGCFIRAQHHRLKASEDSFPPTSAADWSEPFSIVELLYSDHDSEPCKKPCSQKGVLKKHVQIEGLCQDLTDPSAQPHHIGKADFFDQRYCKVPESDEKVLYQCYAHLIDPFFAAPVEKDDRRQFVIAYPISIGGRLHFLQIIASARVKSDVSVCSLWIDWQPIHRVLWTAETRAFLQDELLRIHTSAFQNEAYYHFSKANTKSEDDQHLPLRLLQHIYHLLPVDAGIFRDHCYSYQKYEWPDPPDSTMESLHVGSKWRCAPGHHNSSDEKFLKVTTRYDLTLFLQRKPGGHRASQLTGKHRAEQIVEQQMQYLENLRSALSDEARRKEIDRQKCAMVVYGFLRSMNNPEMEKGILDAARELPTSVLSANVLAPVADVGNDFVPYSFRRPDQKNQFGRFLEQAYPERTQEETVRIVQSLMRPSLLLLLSEYFETGPVKLETHNYEREDILKVSVDEAMQYTESLYAAILSALLKLKEQIKHHKLKAKVRAHGHTKASGTEITAFHRLLSKTIRTQSARDKRQLGLDRRALEMYTFSLGTGRCVPCQTDGAEEAFRKHSRLFGVCPHCLLQDFVREYEKDIASKYRPPNGAFHHECRECKDLLYSSKYHGKQQYDVTIVEHLVFLPYWISDQNEWKDKSELVKCWALTGASIGSLYVFSCSEKNKSIAHLLLVHPDNTSDRTLVPIASRAAEFAQLNRMGSGSYLVIEFQHWWMNDNPKKNALPGES